MAFEETLRWVKSEVELELKIFFREKRQVASTVDSRCAELVDVIADMTLRGGKRIRAYLVWLGHQTARESKVRSKTSQELLQSMVALELFQTFALIHDDIMDEDTVRRCGPTVHEHFKVKSLPLKVKSAKHFGLSMAILVGDLALIWADELMEKGKIDPTSLRFRGARKSKVKSEKIYHRMKEEVIYGQTLDAIQMHQMADVPQQKINELKTAWYTVIRPLQIGAALGGAAQETLDTLAEFGKPVGLLYQLKDDVFDRQLSEADFQKQSKPLLREPLYALGSLKLSSVTRAEFDGFVQFVIDRKF